MASGDLSTRQAMEGRGFYNRNSSVQAVGIRHFMPLWERVAGGVDIGAEPVVIADYGSSQGRNSMAPMRVAIDAVRARAGAHRPVLVYHSDLPTNDFASLFQMLDDDPESYLAGGTGIFPAAIGRSYFAPPFRPSTSISAGTRGRCIGSAVIPVTSRTIFWHG